MFNADKIQTNLYGVVGFRQPYNPDYAILDADNISSTSGEWVTNNPYCKIEHLYDNQDYNSLSDLEFNEQLKRMQEDSIINICHRIFNKPDYIDRQVLYKNAQNRVETEILQSGLVCFKIQVSAKKNVAFKIKRILLDFEGSGDINLMLFNTSQDAPLMSKVITITSTHQVEVLDWVIDNSGDTYKGDYYLGYLTNYVDIGTLKPFKRDYEQSNIMSIVSEMSIQKFQFVGHTTNTLPNLDNEDSIDECLGLNPDITVYKDYTDLITQNKFLLARAINLDLQIKCIEMYMATLRSNINERESQLQITRLTQVVEGVNSSESTFKVTGLRPELSRAINSIQKEVERLQHGYFGERGMIDTLM
jgi:hypothetical protein